MTPISETLRMRLTLHKLGRRARRDWAFDGSASPSDSEIRLRRIDRPQRASASLEAMSKFGPPPQHALARKSLRVVVATVGGTPVGFARVLDCLWDEPAGCLLEEVAVVPERQRQGLGKRLVREGAVWALENGHTRMWCQPAGSGWDRNDFYLPLGFRSDPDLSSLVANLDELCRDSTAAAT